MQRDHLFNRSTRPLLDSPPKSHYHLPTATIIPQLKKQKSSMGGGGGGGDYKLHGFNDFNFVANQYKNLNSTHTGYPYGSPPSTPNTSTYEDSVNVSTPYYDDDSGIHTNNSSENFSCRSNYSPTTINFFGDPIHSCNGNDNDADGNGNYNNSTSGMNSNDQYNYNNTTMHTEFSGNNNTKKGFLKEWSRFGANNHHHHHHQHHHKLTNGNEHNNNNNHNQRIHQPTETQSEQRHLHYNSNKINSIQTPNPVNRLLDNGPFIFGVHSNTCYTLPSKNSTKCDSVIKHSSGASVLATKYTPIDPDANTDDEQDIYGRRCDATVIGDNAQNDSITKHMLASATVENPSTMEYDRKHKKIAEKNHRIKAAEKLTKVKKKRTTKSGNAIKCVVVGDGTVGKTNLISAYLQHRFTTEHVPTASDIYNFEVKVDDKPVQVTLCDTAGQDFLDPLRRLCYPDSDVFVLCFSVIKPDTFVAVREKWMPIFRKSQTPIVLVGTQADLRHDSAVVSQLLANNEKPVSKSDAWDYATLIGAKYIETSSRANINVKEAFDTAIWHALVSMNEPQKPPLWKRLFCLT